MQKKARKELAKPLALFRAAQVFNPYLYKNMSPDDRQKKIDHLCTLPCFQPPANRIRDQASDYVQKCNADSTLSERTDIQEWWLRHKGSLSAWVKGLCLILLFHPTSAAAERVFSLVNNYVSEQQDKLSDEHMKTQLMVQYNNRELSPGRRTPAQLWNFTWTFVRDYFATRQGAARRNAPQRRNVVAQANNN